MKDFRKGFCVALCSLALVVASTMVAKAEEADNLMFTDTGFSFGVGMGFTSEFGGLGAKMYMTEAGHEAAIAKINELLAANGLGAAPRTTKYNGDSGGSLIGLIPEITARYDINHYMFVRVGAQFGQRLTGGQWDVNLVPSSALLTAGAGAGAGAWIKAIEGVNRSLYNQGLDQLSASGKSKFNYKFTSYEVPVVWGLSVPVANAKASVYAAIGLKYACYITEKKVSYGANAVTSINNLNYTGTDDVRLHDTATGLGYVDDAAGNAILDVDGYSAAMDRRNTHWKYALHNYAFTWLIGVEGKVTDDFGLYLETEFTTQTDSTSKKRVSGDTYKTAGAVSSGTCRYYKIGAKYYL